MQLAFIVGARPHFIKLKAVQEAVARWNREAQRDERIDTYTIHTGQHYDYELSGRFFHELELPQPEHRLGCRPGSHAEQTAQMLVGIESVLGHQRPTMVAVFGDTNTTLAGALAAKKLRLPVVHIEAGLRSGDLSVAEELNRVATDHIADLLMCPCPSTYRACVDEGLQKRAFLVGDVTYDAFLTHQERWTQSPARDKDPGAPKRFALATVHRAENTDDRHRLRSIFEALGRLDLPVLFPLHPRTRKALERFAIRPASNITFTEPVGYHHMATLLRDTSVVLTDSSGLQREAFFWRKPCVVIRRQREWTELIESGWSAIADADSARIVATVQEFGRSAPEEPLERDWFGTGTASDRIVEILATTPLAGEVEEGSDETNLSRNSRL